MLACQHGLSHLPLKRVVAPFSSLFLARVFPMKRKFLKLNLAAEVEAPSV